MTDRGATAVRRDEPRRPGRWAATRLRPFCLAPEPVGALSPRSYEAVLTALEQVRKARAFSAAVLERFPGAMPFRMIVEAETRHVEVLAGLLRRRGLAVPPDRHLGSERTRRAVPATAICACRIAAEAAEASARLFETELSARVAGLTDVEGAMRRLGEAIGARRLPALRHWAEHHHGRGGIA